MACKTIKRTVRKGRNPGSKRFPKESCKIWACPMLFFSVMCVLTVHAEPGKEHYEAISRTIVRLERMDSTKTISVGTGFIVNYEPQPYLVTARHVAEKYPSLQTRITVEHKETRELEVIPLQIRREAWIFHPKDSSAGVRYVDIAVAEVPTPRNGVLKVIPRSLLEGQNPAPPELVVCYGYPGSIGILKGHQKPIARVGIVSSEAGDRVRVNIADTISLVLDSQTILLDMLLFPGNSGSPVFRHLLSGRNYLLGLVTVTIQDLEYVACEPLSRIIETLEFAAKNPVSSALLPSWNYDEKAP